MRTKHVFTWNAIKPTWRKGVFIFFFFLLSNQDENSCTYQAAYNGIRIYLLETFALGYIIFKKYHWHCR